MDGFRDFPENGYSDNGYSRGKMQNSYIGWTQEFTLTIIFVMVAIKNDNLGLKMKVLNFLGIQHNDQLKILFSKKHIFESEKS